MVTVLGMRVISGVFDIGHIKILIYPIVKFDTVIFDIGRDYKLLTTISVVNG